MSEEGTRDTATQAQGTAAGDFLAQKVRHFGETISREVEHLRTEASQRAAEGAKGVGLLAGAGAAGAVGAIALGSLSIMALRRVMPGWAIAVSIAGGAGALAAVLARRGLAEIAAAAPGDSAHLADKARAAVRAAL